MYLEFYRWVSPITRLCLESGNFTESLFQPPRITGINNYKHYNPALFCDDLKYPLGYFGTWTNSQWGVAIFQRYFPDSSGQTRTNCNTACSWKICALVNTWDYRISCTSAITSIRKRYQPIVSFTGVITKDYAILSTPKCVKKNVILIPTSSRVTWGSFLESPGNFSGP